MGYLIIKNQLNQLVFLYYNAKVESTEWLLTSKKLEELDAVKPDYSA